MRFPFVSTAMHVEVVAALTVTAQREHEHAQLLRRQLVDLSARYHALRQQGYQLPPDRAPAPEASVVDAVTRAINTMSRGDRRLRADMWAQVSRDRAAGLDDAQIAGAILAGQSSQTLEEFVA